MKEMPASTLAILAGGEGARMGKPKALLTLGGRPILDYLLDRLAWPGPTLLVTAPGRERPPGWNRFTRELVDPAAGGGPLRGVLTALEHLESPLLIVLTVDMPGVRPEQLQWMLARLSESPDELGLMIRRPAAGGFQIEPFPLALTAGARPAIAARLMARRRSVHGLLEERGFSAVAPPPDWEEGVWENLNFPQDLGWFDR